jgi:hypothetical protein
MACVPQSDAAEAPASGDFSQHAPTIHKVFSGPEGEFVDGIHSNVITHIEDTGSLVALQAIDVLRATRLTATDRSIIDGVRPGIPRLESETVTEAPLQCQAQSMVTARPNITLIVHRTERIGIVWIRIVLVQRANAIAIHLIERNRFCAQIYTAPGEEADTMTAQVLGGEQEVGGKLVFDREAPGLDI